MLCPSQRAAGGVADRGTCPIMCPHPLRSSFWGVKSLESRGEAGLLLPGPPRLGPAGGAPRYSAPGAWEDVYLSHNRRNGGLLPLLRL